MGKTTLERGATCPACDASLPASPPTGKVIVARDSAGRTLLVVKNAAPFAGAWSSLFFAAAWLFVLAPWADPVRGVAGLLRPLVIAGTTLWLVGLTTRRVRFDTVEISGDALDLGRHGVLGSLSQRVPLGEIAGADVESSPFTREHRVVLVRSDAAPLRIGAGLGHSRDAAEWLAARVTSEVHERRRR